MAILTIINGGLRVRNNALVTGETTPCCCDYPDCKQCYCFWNCECCDSESPSYSSCSDELVGGLRYLTTITVPDIFPLPVKVVARGEVDDVFVLNSDEYFDQDPTPHTGTTRHDFGYSWTQSSREFTVAALDTRGDCVGMNIEICIYAIDLEYEPEEHCDPVICLPGSLRCPCCSSITQEDLRYGSAPYSWPQLKPSSPKTPMYGDIGPQPTSGSTGSPGSPSGPPGYPPDDCGPWVIREACLRWLCRCVDCYETVLCSEAYGGPTVNNLDLNQLVVDTLGFEDEPGCYVYTFVFYGWYRPGRPNYGYGYCPPGWISRDDIYTIHKTRLEDC